MKEIKRIDRRNIQSIVLAKFIFRRIAANSAPVRGTRCGGLRGFWLKSNAFRRLFAWRSLSVNGGKLKRHSMNFSVNSNWYCVWWEYKSRHSKAKTILIYLGWRNMIVESTIIIPCQDYRSVIPIRTAHYRRDVMFTGNICKSCRIRTCRILIVQIIIAERQSLST